MRTTKDRVAACDEGNSAIFGTDQYSIQFNSIQFILSSSFEKPKLLHYLLEKVNIPVGADIRM